MGQCEHRVVQPIILGLDLRSGDVVVHEHKICLSCLSVVVHLALENQLDQEE